MAEDVSSLMEPDAHAELLEGAERSALRDQLTAALATIPERAADVVRRRFGLADGGAATLYEIAHELGVSGPRVRQIEAEALRKLRHPTRSRPLREFLHGAPDTYRAPVRPGQCQRREQGLSCADRVDLPGWIRAQPVEEMRRPMFWCEACWQCFVTTRQGGAV